MRQSAFFLKKEFDFSKKNQMFFYPTRFNPKLFFSLVCLLLAMIMLVPQITTAATITVTNCASDSSAGSLRAAIASATAGDTVNFALDCSGAGAITLSGANTTFSINKNLTIDGTGHNITVSGNNAVQVFSIATGKTVILNHLDIIKGGSGIDSGGGIENFGTLTVSNSTFSKNSATGGGSICNCGTLTVSSSTFSENSAVYGGGIENCNGSTLTVSNSTFFGNLAVYGGGICNFGTSTVSSSTFSGNSASYSGGGIVNWNSSTLIVGNSTFSGNSADYYGGGIDNWNGTLTVSNSTFSGNSANYYYGGGIVNKDTGTLTISNSILANSIAGGDCYKFGGTINITNTLIESNGSGANSCGIPSFTDDPKLKALADNGGSTKTMALSAGSPAINAGEPATCTPTDQRGYARVGICDIGAYEYVPPPPDAPGGLTAASVSQTQIDLSWADNSSDETGFKIFRNGLLITTTAANTGMFSDTGLTFCTTYNYEVKATNAGGDSSGSIASATTICPGVSMVSITNIKAATAIAIGSASGDGIGERGFYWWIPPTPETHWGGSESGLLPEGGCGAGIFSLNITGLKPGFKYHIKAYIKVGGQLITSDEQIFTAAATDKTAPTVITKGCALNTDGTVSATGEITDIGSSAVNVYGFVYAKHPAPYTGDNMFSTGDKALALWDKASVYQGMSFAGTIKNLTPGKWYLRAYAHNDNPDSDTAQTASLSYGENCIFTVPCTPETCIPGDVSGDGKVSLDDAMLVLRILAGMPIGNINIYADVNNDGKIGLPDLVYILQKAAEMR